MSGRRSGKKAARPEPEEGQRSMEDRVRKLVAASRPAPGPVLAEVHDALDRLGTIFGMDMALVAALKDELGVRLLNGESPDFFIYRPESRPQRLILLNHIEEGGRCRVDAAAVHEECSHALRSIHHPYEHPMIQEFFGALGPVLALDRRLMSGGPMLDAAGTLWEMSRGGGGFKGVPDELASKLQKFIPPDMLAEAVASGGNDGVAAGFLQNALTHMIPTITAESMADTGWLAELMERYPLMLLPPKEISGILTEYGKRCALDPEWKEKFKRYRKVCGYYLKKG